MEFYINIGQHYVIEHLEFRLSIRAVMPELLLLPKSNRRTVFELGHCHKTEV
jgi:hypothetical protein